MPVSATLLSLTEVPHLLADGLTHKAPFGGAPNAQLQNTLAARPRIGDARSRVALSPRESVWVAEAHLSRAKVLWLTFINGLLPLAFANGPRVIGNRPLGRSAERGMSLGTLIGV
jgi:hypothetical protein